ncbi:MAG TPA: NADH-quinone oxidoreductase subunit J [Thermoanaerobaculia bacterium]|nr:NADH-quinone oxidoreductase subunit J [Thermoanaerobaculia bacterium]HUM29521.1 NADH-quinone oxidoreductase subunit J [Thermoanaerobaculia bacterium]HXK67904.1 NADH-quinone oxidoreductase subunit J [Thermoanaerobaculia bacterium]
MLPVILFYTMAFIALLFSMVVILHKNPVTSAMSLVVLVCSLAVIFFQLDAPFIAAIQIVVYAGAIIVLFLFVIMLLNLRAEVEEPEDRPLQKYLSYISFFAFLVVISGVVRLTTFLPERPMVPDPLRDLAYSLFSTYLFPFEAVTVLLMAAVVGAFILTRKEWS